MNERKLIIDQLDRKIIRFRELEDLVIPSKGWIYSIRKALNMSLRQLGNKLSITPQSVKEIEEREESGTVSLKVLYQVSRALDMKFVYGFIPGSLSLKKMIETRAYEIAKEIVGRSSVSMNLEDQKLSDERIDKELQEKAGEIINKMPRYLWD